MPQNQKKEKTPLHLRLTYEDWKNCFKDLTRGELGVLLAIRCLDPYGDRFADLTVRTLEIDCEKLSRDLGLHRTSVSRALESLNQKGLINYPATGRNINRIESKIRDRLKAQLGGLVEVKTLAGRIDLLTETQIIEVKRINDWKSALGQVLAYSAFYPEHQKRLHLFGNAGDESKVSDIGNSCLAFDVLVSFELVSSEVEEM